MTEVRRSLRRLALYALLLCAGSLLDLIPDRFYLENLSSVYCAVLSACLIVYYYLRVSGSRRLRRYMLGIALMEFLLMASRAVKYSVFGNTFILGRYTWYFYYVPMLGIPLLLLCIALNIYANEDSRPDKKQYIITGITIFFMLFILTNDLHQQAFGFRAGFEGWDWDYTHNWGYFAVTALQSLMYLAAVILLVMKCRISGIRGRIWLILIPVVIGCTSLVLIFTGNRLQINGVKLLELPETILFMTAGVLECCMQLGLIPTNESYGNLLHVVSVPVLITDTLGTVIYRSDTARPLTPEEFTAADNTRIAAHTILHRMDISGGYGFWQKDVTEQDRINDELADIRQQLSEEAELTRLQNKLRESQAETEQRILIYDTIARHIQDRSQEISRLSREALDSEDIEQRDRNRRHIMLLGAYIKRYANLSLLASKYELLSVGELELSVAELLRYLNMYGIPGEVINTASGELSPDQALAVYEKMFALIDDNLPWLKGAYCNISVQDTDTIVKLTLEQIPEDISRSVADDLSPLGIGTSYEYEDGIGYFRFMLGGKGGSL